MKTTKFLETLIEPQLEVIKRVSFSMGPISIADHEPKLLAAAMQLAAERWLIEGSTYPCAGQNYHRFEPGPLLEMSELEVVWKKWSRL